MTVTRGHFWQRQIWIAYRDRYGGRWHNYYRWRIGHFLHRWWPAAWRVLKAHKAR